MIWVLLLLIGLRLVGLGYIIAGTDEDEFFTYIIQSAWCIAFGITCYFLGVHSCG